MRNRTNSALEKEFESLNLPQKPLSRQQQERILAMAMKKVDCDPCAAAPYRKSSGSSARRHGFAFRRVLSIAAAAVALFCVVGVTAVAVAPALLQMLHNQIGFFENAPVQSAVTNPADAPRGEYPETQSKVEAYNAEVNQSVTSNGVTITLDTLSMDSATMNAFFTITGDQAVKGVLDPDKYLPEWSQLWGSAPRFYQTTINGASTAAIDCTDFYRLDDNTLKLWIHYQLSEVPQGESVTVEFLENWQALGVDGEWKFTVQLDGASVRAGGRAVKPGTYLSDTDRPLELTTLTFGPVGGVIGAHQKDIRGTLEDGTEYYQTEGRSAAEFLITDNTGKTLFATKDSTGSFGGGGEDGYTLCYNLTAPDAAATELTLTPVSYAENGGEQRTITSEEMKNGVKIETSPLGGYTVQNMQVGAGVITWELVPYGWNTGVRSEIQPDDDDLISYVAESGTDADTGEIYTAYHSALSTNTFDPQTGVYTCRLDYYAATEEQLSKITTWHYYYSAGYSLDTAHALTLPLENVS